MSLRNLVEPDCGGANPLMRLGSHLMHDAAYKDQGLGHGGAGPSFVNRPGQQQPFGADQLVNEFLGQVSSAPPQTFRMDALLQEMREIDAHQFQPHVVRAPPVIEEVNSDAAWAAEMAAGGASGNHLFLNENKGPNSVKNNPL